VTGRGKGRFKIRDLIADRRSSQLILHFLTTTDVGRRVSEGGSEGRASGLGMDHGTERAEGTREDEPPGRHDGGESIGRTTDGDGPYTI